MPENYLLKKFITSYYFTAGLLTLVIIKIYAFANKIFSVILKNHSLHKFENSLLKERTWDLILGMSSGFVLYLAILVFKDGSIIGIGDVKASLLAYSTLATLTVCTRAWDIEENFQKRIDILFCGVAGAYIATTTLLAIYERSTYLIMAMVLSITLTSFILYVMSGKPTNAENYRITIPTLSAAFIVVLTLMLKAL
ncbi:hypothetical protein [Salinicola halophyticus]|uniref:hypothetical protein n=1 Tax=Salinicola halophyticus TaxID=1808881 RepID=UPI000DA17373|nr:hypothetical protein [Salinicola halophyticus]